MYLSDRLPKQNYHHKNAMSEEAQLTAEYGSARTSKKNLLSPPKLAGPAVLNKEIRLPSISNVK